MKPYLWPMVWMGIIFIFSTDLGGIQNSNAFFIPLIKLFWPNLSRPNLISALILIRKVGHLVEYAILSVLWFRAFSQHLNRNSWQSVLGAIGISALYATLDELHQLFVPTRTASLTDVGIDTVGAILGQIVWQFFLRFGSWFRVLPVRFFGWWFAWGCFSSILVLIVAKGGGLSAWQVLAFIVGVGFLSGIGGVIYHVRSTCPR